MRLDNIKRITLLCHICASASSVSEIVTDTALYTDGVDVRVFRCVVVEMNCIIVCLQPSATYHFTYMPSLLRMDW